MEDQNIRIRPPLWLPILVALIAGGSYIAGKTVETRHTDRVTVSVQGEGKVSAVPDIATLSFGVETGRQKTADAAMLALTKKMTAILEAVSAAGVEEKDVRNQRLSLNPAYDWEEGKRVDRGFEATQSLVVKIRDLTKISEVLDVAVKAGANQAGSVGFTIDDPDELRAQARDEAIKDAESKAVILADQLGVTLGEFRGYWEDTGSARPMPMMEKSMAYGMGGGSEDAVMAPPIPAGEQEIVVRVNVTFSVKD